MRMKRKRSRQPEGGPVKAVRWVGKTAVIEVAGDIDLASSPVFQDSLLAVLDDEPSRIIVNLAGVPYMDSSGVATLIKVLRKVRGVGATMALAAMTERVHGIFEITKLDGFFEVHATEQEALST